jgi:acyl-CoA thioester hydrolase
MQNFLQFRLKIFYEDTDAGGVVYHSNYLNFAERARSEMMSSIGINQVEIAEKYSIFFVVKQLTIEFKKPAKLENKLIVITKIIRINKASIDIEQEIFLENSNEKLVIIKDLSIVCVKKNNNNFQPTKIPQEIDEKLQKLLI